jgi:hypothetical protein
MEVELTLPLRNPWERISGTETPHAMKQFGDSNSKPPINKIISIRMELSLIR